MQVYSMVSTTIDSGIAIANGANPFRIVGATVGAFALSTFLPGGGTYDNLFMQVAVHAARGAAIGAATSAILGGDIAAGAIGGGIGQGVFAGTAIGGATAMAAMDNGVRSQRDTS